MGKHDNTPEIATLLSKLGCRRKPRLEPGALDVPIWLMKLGLGLIFKPVNNYKTGRLELVEVQIYSNHEEGFSPFQGKLPHGLTFKDSRKEVLKKLGKPARSQRLFRLDSWDGLTVKYIKGEGQIKMLHLVKGA